MAYCEGECLTERIGRGPVPWRQAADIAIQVADALAAAHALGIVHRDVKPANIVVSPDGRARLMDFGIALADGTAGRPAGTPAYMSPEHCRGEPASPAADVWSLGVLIGEMFTARRPTDTDPVVGGARRPRTRDRNVLRRSRRPARPRRLVRLVHQCLSIDPAARPAAIEVAAELRATLARRSAARAAVVLLAAVSVLAGAAAWLMRPADGSQRNGTVAVLPFSTGGNPTLEPVSRELAMALRVRVDGVGGLRAVDPETFGLAGRVLEVGATTPLLRARSPGASMIVTGEVARSGTLLRAVARVQDPAGAHVVEAVAPAADGVSGLADSLVLALFRSDWSESIVPGLSDAAAGTSSVDALRAFVEGEVAVAGARFRHAPEAFARAMNADSTFWLAYLRYWFTRSYHGSPVDPAITAAVVDRRATFPEPDRMLVEARIATGGHDRLQRLRDVTVRHPAYWPGWFELGDFLTHHGSFFGIPLDEARDALRRASHLNPGFVPAWEHAFWTAVLARDTADSRKVLARLEELRLDTLVQREWDLRPLAYYGYLDHLSRTGGSPREADAEIGAAVLSSVTTGADPEQAAATLLLYGFNRAQLDLSRRIVEAAPSRTASAHTWGSALAWAGRGGWDSAFASARQYARSTTHERGALWAFGLAVTGAWLGRIHPDSAATLRPLARRSPAGRTNDGDAEIAWLDGVLACTTGDIADLEHHRLALQRNSAPAAAGLARSLDALAHAVRGNASRAAIDLARLERDHADRNWAFAHGRQHPFASAVNRLAAGRWLLTDGDTATAAALLLLHETDLPNTLHPLAPAQMILSSVSLSMLADVEDARGRPEHARRHRTESRQRADLLDASAIFEPCIDRRRVP
jgi:serine/threonine-protein kinase